MNKLKTGIGLGLVVLACGLWAWRPLAEGKGGMTERGQTGGRGVTRLGDERLAVAMGGMVERSAAGGLTGRAGAAGEATSWMTIDEAAGKLQKEQRPVLIDLYTTWCGWCKQMDKKTYSNKQVAQYLQDKFYAVKVDAETHATISWKGRTYQFNPGYKSNEFALYLTHGQLEFPTTIIIPPGGEPQAIPGYMEPKELELLVKYFGEGQFGKVGFDEYQKSFKPSW